MKRNKIAFGARLFILIIAIGGVSCIGKRLPEEKVQAYQEEMEDRKIIRINESEIITGANEIGDKIANTLDSIRDNNTENLEEAIKLLSEEYNAEINNLGSDKNYSEEVNKILEAYLFSKDEGANAGANIQVLDDGSIFYSRPILEDSLDSKTLKGVWGITLQRKEIVKRLQ